MQAVKQIYPWQKDCWESITRQMADGRLPHAVLLRSSENIGLQVFASALAKRLLCNQPNHLEACGDCQSCHLFEVGTHPDFYKLSPEVTDKGKVSKVIKVDQVRKGVSDLLQTALRSGGRKVLVIAPAESMNANAANALLKSLEEPPQDTYFILISLNSARLLPTIRSRCQSLDVPDPNWDQAESWLAGHAMAAEARNELLRYAAGNPLLIEQWQTQGLADDILSLEKNLLAVQSGRLSLFALALGWQKTGALQVLSWWWTWLSWKLKETSSKPSALHRSYYVFMDRLLANKRYLESTANPNEQLMLEALLIDWKNLEPLYQ